MSFETPKKTYPKRGSQSGVTHVIQTKPIERRTELRRIVHERFNASLSVIANNESTDDNKHAVKPGVSVSGVVTDISESGIGLVLDGSCAPGQEVSVHIVAQNEEGDIKARVAWVRELPSRGNVIKLGAPRTAWRVGLEVIREAAPGPQAEFIVHLLKTLEGLQGS